MSTLFSVIVKQVSATSARLAVESIHPDSGPPRATSTFALMLLFDPIISAGYTDMEQYTHLEAAPLAAAMSKADYLEPSWLVANANAFVAKTSVSKGVLEIWPTHPAWIEHLRVGMTWETAAYSNGPGKNTTPRAPSKTPPAHSSDRAAGFRVGKPKMPLDGVTLEKAHIPLYGSTRYVADPMLSDRKAIAAALASLEGEPVLVVPKRGPTEVGTLVRPSKAENRIWFHLYTETSGSHGYMGVNLDDVKSLGRAWLVVERKLPAKARPPR